MKKLVFLAIFLIAASCGTQDKKPKLMSTGISRTTIDETISLLIGKHSGNVTDPATRGVRHAGSLWRPEDGSEENFKQFCLDQFIASPEEKTVVFNKLSGYFESLYGHFSRLSLELRQNLDLDNGPLHRIDEMFGAYSVNAHFSDDFYANKIAFIIALNFPYYTLDEKNELGKTWSDKDWAYARLGDLFIYRIPAELQQKASDVTTSADIYISEYNIHMGKLVDNEGKQLFPEDMVLLSHWNLRDELKSAYADREKGPDKQKMIYEVMKRIIRQEIPGKVINSREYIWNPYTNKTTKDGQEISLASEPDTRYRKILDNFHAMREIDPYTPALNTFIQRKFSGEMEIPQPGVERIFDEYLRSPVFKELAAIVRQRLGRDLLPFDIWYDGFKARSAVSQEKLDQITQKMFPDADSFEAGMPALLMKLGFSREKSEELSRNITVDPARGSGHAWGAMMRSDKSHLRTRIGESGMNYKGYNIAIHEFGHNVEQTISLHDVPYYSMSGVPNTGFTEALAFLFQGRDLELLGIRDDDPGTESLKTLDICWHTFEIMGVSMVDMRMWKWMYDNPDATAAQLKDETIRIATDIWNTYFADAFGLKDEPILTVYSHMVNSPLYLSNYSVGALIEFQLGRYMKGKDFGREVERIWSQGRLTPQAWMLKAVGQELSAQPLLDAAADAIRGL